MQRLVWITPDGEMLAMVYCRASVPLLPLLAVVLGGCASPYYADRGALFGGLTGAGVGAIVGDAVGNPAAGAAIGAGVGAVTGATVGEALDDIEARNRAQIAAQLGRPVQPGAATIGEVVAMSRAGVDERLIVNHIEQSGVAGPLQAGDVIELHEQGVPARVIEVMQSPPRRVAAVQPVVYEEHYYEPPPFHCRPRHHYHHPHRPRASWGVSISH